MIILAHNCAVLGVPCDTVRLFGEPPGDYHLALEITCEAVAATERREQERAEREARRG